MNNIKTILLLIGCFGCSSIHANNMFARIKHFTTKPLDIVLSTGDASKETTENAISLFKQLDEKINKPDIQVKKMGKLAQYIFGYQNTIALPFINKIYVNEKWLNSLTPDQRKFVIGRTVLLLSKPSKYYIPKMLINITYRAINNYYCNMYKQLAKDAGSNKDDFFFEEIEKMSRNPQEDSAHLIALAYLDKLAKCTSLYMDRKTEYALDTQTATTFNCAAAATEVLMGLRKCKNDKSIFGKLSSIISLATVLDIATKTDYYKPVSWNAVGNFVDQTVTNITKRLPDSKYSTYTVKFLNTLKTIHKHTPGKLLAIKSLKEAIDYAPGQLHTMPSKIDQELYNYNPLTKFPGNPMRILNLRDAHLAQLPKE